MNVLILFLLLMQGQNFLNLTNKRGGRLMSELQRAPQPDVGNSNKKFELEKGIFYPPAILLVVFLLIGMVSPDGFAKGANAALGFTIDYFGWMYLFFAFIFLAFVLFVTLAPIGRVRFGGPDAKPELSYWNWFAMALCAGIAIGILFWGVAEPIYHYYGPPSIAGVDPQTPGSAITALQLSYLHWSFHPYALYAIIGLAIAYSSYNLNQPFKVSSGLYPIIGDRINGFWGNTVDAICIFAIVGGVVTSLGLGTMQLAGGLNYLIGLTPNIGIYIAIITIITISYTLSSYTGLHRGIKFLSNHNAKIFIGFVVFLFLLGPTKFLLEIGVNSFGSYLVNVIPMSFWADPFGEGAGWSGSWTIFYWAWWIAFAPIVGMFIARISYGRTIREFLIVNVTIPALFGILWFTAFGGSAIYLESVESGSIMNVINESGFEVASYALLSHFPLSFITVPFFVIVVAISFITLADSMTSTIAIMTTKNRGQGEPPAVIKVFWGLVMGGSTILFLIITGVSGTKALQTASIVTALPIFIIEMAIMISVIMMFYKKGYAKQE
jgi:choline/carnitine/betaine transport